MKKIHPLLGQIGEPEEDLLDPPAEGPLPGSLVGMAWDDELGGPVPPPPPAPPVDIAALAEEEEPGLRTMARKVVSAALRRLARKIEG